MADSDVVAFRNKIWQTMQQGGLATCICLGSRLGLFDFLAKAKSPMTSQEIADQIMFKERYVREWLGAMACGGIIEVKDGKFWLPENHRAVMAGSNPMNVASFSWAISMFAQVTDDLMECFKLDGPAGLPYSKFPIFHEWREFKMNATYTWETLKEKFEQVPGIIERLESGIEMAELGCSTGYVSFILAKRFPKSTIYGYDISEEAVEFANKKAQSLGIRNVHFFSQDCCKMPEDWTGKWEYMVALDLVHDVPKTTDVLREICRVLKPGCFASIIDINVHTNLEDNLNSPVAGLVYTMSLFHCMPVSLAAEG